MTDTVRALICPQCGGTIALRAGGLTVSLICEHCGATLDTTRDDVRVIAAAHRAMLRPQIPLGTRGTLRGETWEVIGYLERTDGYAGWQEYLLFNPYAGYRFLVDDGRCFSLGQVVDRTPDWAFKGCTLDGLGYHNFGAAYDASVNFVVGEFYWRVAMGERVKASDHVRPGAMLTCEQNEHERTWTLLTLLDMGEAEKAFGIEQRARPSHGTPSPHEPSPHMRPLREAGVVFAAAMLALIAVLVALGPARRTLLTDTFALTVDAAPIERVVAQVSLPAPYNRVTIAAEARELDNGWVDLDYALVGRNTQRRFDAYALAERYSGSDSDGSWSEGDRSPNIAFASVPGGTYDLVVEASFHGWTGAQAPPATGQVVPVTLRLATGGSFVGPMVLAILALALWPVLLAIRHLRFEHRRLAPVRDDD
ncbi:DUF4178 domain-containing protein [Sphingomonas sanguinis]|uniref:DUF4178 domain-containing protein n=1 Tax=Sphingomonas sanguinis TaxID=33051 RepID=UPI001C58EB4B|nr:DUF4178 domain-containing protein [Sphingomonas sanguinis]QXT36071.1 DUF4178 domain-containing protein [Sphingomonas sanguinis]